MTQNCDLPILRVGAKPDFESDCAQEAAARKIYAEYSHAIVQIDHDNFTGSGFFIEDGSRIVTNAHVVDGATGLLNVQTIDHKEYQARIEKLDDINDLAILRLEDGAKGPQTLTLGDSNALTKGEMLWGLGHPLGKYATYISPGHFTEKGPFDQIFASKDAVDEDWQTFLKTAKSADPALARDAEALIKSPHVEAELQIEGGNSGGPMITSKGQVIGVSQFGSELKQYHKYAWAVPSEQVLDIEKSAPKFLFDYEKISEAHAHPVMAVVKNTLLGGLVLGLPRVGGILAGLGATADIGLMAADGEKPKTAADKIHRGLEYTSDAFLVAGAVLSWIPRLKPLSYASYALGMAASIGESFVPHETALVSIKRTANPMDKREPLYWHGID